MKTKDQTKILLPLALVLLLLPQWIPSLKLKAFCAPSARMASELLPAPLMEEGGVPCILTGDDRALRISEDCAAYDFFILFSLLGIWGLNQWRPKVLRHLLWVVTAYALTLPLNALRIFTSLHLQQLARPHLPSDFQYPLHLLAGVLVFLPMLILVHLAFQQLKKAKPYALRT